MPGTLSRLRSILLTLSGPTIPSTLLLWPEPLHDIALTLPPGPTFMWWHPCLCCLWQLCFSALGNPSNPLILPGGYRWANHSSIINTLVGQVRVLVHTTKELWPCSWFMDGWGGDWSGSSDWTGACGQSTNRGDKGSGRCSLDVTEWMGFQLIDKCPLVGLTWW